MDIYDGAGTSALFAFFAAFLGFIIFYGLIAYIVSAIALKRMADKLSVENSWLAWVPIANVYILGKVAGDKLDLFGYQIDNLAIILLAGSVISGAISGIPVIGFLVAVAFAILSFATLYKIYLIFVPDSAMLYLILSIVLAIIAPFILYAASKKEPIIEDVYIE
ncbi:MAG: hypothetical protein RBR71_10615 [Gudongella sp.]|nr:hypothetical protein [Gudongella sp.]